MVNPKCYCSWQRFFTVQVMSKTPSPDQQQKQNGWFAQCKERQMADGRQLIQTLVASLSRLNKSNSTTIVQNIKIPFISLISTIFNKHIIVAWRNMKNFKSWLPNEDQALLKVYRDRSIQKWAKISSILQTEYGIQKSAKKCRQRFKNHLNPSIKKDEWSEDQERTLLNLHEDIGNRWAQISRRLSGRTDNAVKNKFYSLFRKAVSNINSLVHKEQPSHFKQIQIPFIYKLVSLIDDKHKSNSLLPEQVIRQAEALKSKIFQYKYIEVETYVLGEGQLQGLFNMVQSVNSYFKKKMIRKSRRKISSTKNSSMEALQTNLKFPTEENLITLEKISGPEPSFEIKQMRHNFENPLFHISPTLDKMIMKNQHNMNELCIQQLHNEDSDIWKVPKSEYNDYSDELY